MIEVPTVVRNKVRAAGAEDWLEALPTLVSGLEADWSIVVGRPYQGGSEAFVAEATRADGTDGPEGACARDGQRPLP
jgi:streptomycin 6-kinase